MTVNTAARAKMLVDAQNRRPGNLTGFDCPDCLNRGYSLRMDDMGQCFAMECGCMVRRRNAKRLEKSGLSDMIQRYTFDTWQTPEQWQSQAMRIAGRYAAGRHGWFLAAGHSGSGKTHLCTAICARLMEAGMDTRYMLWRDEAVRAKAVVNSEEEYFRVVGPLKEVQVLYIDDLFKTGGKEPSEPDVKLAFEILNYRYIDSKKLTIISTERSMDDLLNIDEALGSRIYEKSKNFYLDFSDKPNWRLRV